MAMDMTIEQRVAAIIAEHLCRDQAKATPDAHLVDDLGADSLDCVEITMALEDEFGIKISDDDAARCHRVQDWAQLVASRKA